MGMTFEEACAAVCAPGSMFEISDGEVLGTSMKVFSAAPPNIKALFALAAAREDDFIVFEDERWSMPRVLQSIGQIGEALVNTYGVKKGDRVAIAMRNYPEWITAFSAIVGVGAVAVPLNAWWVTDELVFAINDSGATVVIADDERLERILAADAGAIDAQLVVVRAEGELADCVSSLEDALVEGATLPEVDIQPDDDITILYTSGTTGRPKGAVSSHRAVISALLAFASRAAVGDLVEPSEPDPDRGQTTFMLCVPLFHVTGLIPVMLGSFVGVPTMSWDLLEAPTFADRDTSSLIAVGGGGAPMPPELVKRIDENFAKGRPALGYGMTETNAYGPQNAGAAFLAKPKSSGRPVPVMEMRITDADGNVLPAGEVGEIWFKGPSLIKGYWNRPDATAETIVDGWLRSGDIGHLDEDGDIFISDRAKDMILRGGENIYCAEVEGAIYEHPAVYEVAVYGIPHERLGEDLACHVMVKPGETLTAEELQAFVGERLAKFKVPAVVTLVDEQLPRNASGKILKKDLRDAYQPPA